MMRIIYAVLVALILAVPARSAQETGAQLYEDGYMESLFKLVDWIQKLDQKIDSWIKTEEKSQLARRTKRLAAQLYKLCASKRDLAVAVDSRRSDATQLRAKASQVSGDVQDVLEALRGVGSDLRMIGEKEPETAIYSGLNGKITQMELIEEGLESGQIDRKKIGAEVQKSYDLCSAAQTHAETIARKLAGP
jgi:hypothetical protein